MLLKPLSPGSIVVLVVILLFYLRLMMLRGRKIKEERALAAKRKKSSGKHKAEEQPFRPRYEVTSWWIVAPAMVLMLLGLAIGTTGWFPATLQPYSWVPVALGGVMFLFAFK